MENFDILVLSDSTGHTGEEVAKSLISQFDCDHYRILRYPHIFDMDDAKNVFEKYKDKKPGVVISTLVDEELLKEIRSYCEDREIEIVDIFENSIKVFERALNQKAKRKPGMTRELDNKYFQMINSVEFAVQYDDGKDPRGLPKADIVLIGVSRTSKTPLSLLLAYKNYRVANLPLVPEIEIPEELYQVDNRRIFGLIISKEKLTEARSERLRRLGLSGESAYTEEKRVEEELAFARNLMEDLDVPIINVSEQTIEETATIILSKIRENFPDSMGHRLDEEAK